MMAARKQFVWIPAVLCVYLCISCHTGVFAGPQEDRLITQFFEERIYHVSSRPVAIESEAIDVKLGISLQQIVDVNEKNELLQTNMWLKYEWIDYKLVWNASEYGGVESIRLPSKAVWTPDILLYNTASDAIDSKFPTNVVLSSNGLINWIPLGLFKSSCAIDITWFPFDEQYCPMKFGSWTYDGNKLNLTAMKESVDMSTYQQSGEWEIRDVSVNRSVISYECCPEPYIDITFTIHLRRRTLYYGINLIVPCAMISFLSLLIFVLPPGEGEKIGLGITILLSLSVFQLIVAESVPATSLHVPLLGVYFVTVMFMCTLSVISTVIVLNFHHRTPDMYEMPEWVRIVFCEWLAWIVRIKRPGHDLTWKSLKLKNRQRQKEKLQRKSPVIASNARNSDTVSPDSPPIEDVELANLIIGDEKGSDRKGNGNNNCGNVSSASQNCDTTKCNIEDGISFDASGVCDPTNADPAATNAGNSELTMAIRNELVAIRNDVRWMTTKVEDEKSAGDMTNDWKFVAMVVDRICLWIFSTYLVLGTVIIFSRSFYHYYN